MRPQQRKSKPSQSNLPEFFEQRLLMSAVAATPSVALTSSPIPVIERHVVPKGPPFGGGGGSATPPTGAFTPQQIESAYSASGITLAGGVVGNGAGQTIALVDAFNYPSALVDLQGFDSFYGLPNPPSFEVMSQRGSLTALPGTDPAGQPGQGDDDWESEESLDIEWAHAMAPGASLILVEADSADTLFAAAKEAATLPNVSVVSMSFGADEVGSDATDDSNFVSPAGHPVTFVAAAGDSGAFSPGTSTLIPSYPATSPNVVAVGGTTLTLNGSTYGSERVWGEGAQSGTDVDGGGGGGISSFEPQPAFQHLLVTQSTTARTSPDVAMEADPLTGVAEFDSYDSGSATPWTEIGGTSLATPLFAGILSIADQARTLNGMLPLNGVTQTLPLLYSLPEADFHDVTTGNNGYPAGPGYDLGSGRGSVIASKLVTDLSSTYIGAYVFNDTSFNGVQDSGEAGIAGITVDLEKAGADGIGGADSTIIQTTTTDTYGLYEFVGMAPGSYYVHIVAPAGFDVSPVGTSPVVSTNSVVDQSGNSGLIPVTTTTDNNLVNAGIYQASISINNVSISRPHSGLEAMTFTVTLSPTNLNGASVPFTTEDGTATVANDDYEATSGTLVFAPGVTSETITVEAVGNTTIENDVTFTVNLTPPAGFNPVQTVGTGTILNSNFPTVTITSPAAQTRSGTATLTYAFTVQLSEPAPFAVSVPYTTTDASAVGGVDYTAAAGILIFPAGTTGPQTIDITVLAGTNPQLDKIFYLTLEASTTAVLGTPSQGIGTILTNDPPSIAAETGSVTESVLGLSYLPFTVNITPSLTGPVTISYATSNGTAVAGTDYQAETGTLTFPAGRIQEVVYVPVYQQFIAAQSKTVGFTISNPNTNILIATASVVGTIDYQPLTALPFSNGKRATYTDSLNQRVVVSLKGLGSGNVVFIGTNSSNTNAFEIVTNGTNSASNVTISVVGGKQTSLTNLIVNGSIGTISAKTVNILSSLSSTSSMNSLSVGYVSASTISIGGASTGQSVALTFNRVLNSTINSAIPIRSLTATAYLDTTGSPTYINAPSVGKVKVKGNFGGTIKTTSLASLNVGGLIDSGGVLATGTIGSVTAEGIVNSDFFAGVNGGNTSLPSSSKDFANVHSSIGSIRVNGGVFSDSLIAGWDIGSVSVADIGTVDGAANFGISANHVGKIRTGGIGASHKVLSLINPTTATSIDNFVIQPV